MSKSKNQNSNQILSSINTNDEWIDKLISENRKQLENIKKERSQLITNQNDTDLNKSDISQSNRLETESYSSKIYDNKNIKTARIARKSSQGSFNSKLVKNNLLIEDSKFEIDVTYLNISNKIEYQIINSSFQIISNNKCSSCLVLTKKLSSLNESIIKESNNNKNLIDSFSKKEKENELRFLTYQLEASETVNYLSKKIEEENKKNIETIAMINTFYQNLYDGYLIKLDKKVNVTLNHNNLLESLSLTEDILRKRITKLKETLEKLRNKKETSKNLIAKPKNKSEVNLKVISTNHSDNTTNKKIIPIEKTNKDNNIVNNLNRKLACLNTDKSTKYNNTEDNISDYINKQYSKYSNYLLKTEENDNKLKKYPENIFTNNYIKNEYILNRDDKLIYEDESNNTSIEKVSQNIFENNIKNQFNKDSQIKSKLNVNIKEKKEFKHKSTTPLKNKAKLIDNAKKTNTSRTPIKINKLK